MVQVQASAQELLFPAQAWGSRSCCPHCKGLVRQAFHVHRQSSGETGLWERLQHHLPEQGARCSAIAFPLPFPMLCQAFQPSVWDHNPQVFSWSSARRPFGTAPVCGRAAAPLLKSSALGRWISQLSTWRRGCWGHPCGGSCHCACPTLFTWTCSSTQKCEVIAIGRVTDAQLAPHLPNNMLRATSRESLVHRGFELLGAGIGDAHCWPRRQSQSAAAAWRPSPNWRTRKSGSSSCGLVLPTPAWPTGWGVHPDPQTQGLQDFDHKARLSNWPPPWPQPMGPSGPWAATVWPGTTVCKARRCCILPGLAWCLREPVRTPRPRLPTCSRRPPCSSSPQHVECPAPKPAAAGGGIVPPTRRIWLSALTDLTKQVGRNSCKEHASHLALRSRARGPSLLSCPAYGPHGELRQRLGVADATTDAWCPRCDSVHAATCCTGGERTTRRNALRDAVCQCADRAGLQPEKRSLACCSPSGLQTPALPDGALPTFSCPLTSVLPLIWPGCHSPVRGRRPLVRRRVLVLQPPRHMQLSKECTWTRHSLPNPPDHFPSARGRSNGCLGGRLCALPPEACQGRLCSRGWAGRPAWGTSPRAFGHCAKLPTPRHPATSHRAHHGQPIAYFSVNVSWTPSEWPSFLVS